MKKNLIFASLLTCIQFTTFTMEHHGYQKVDIAFDEIWDTEDIPLTPSFAEASDFAKASSDRSGGRQTSPEQPQKDVSEDKISELVTLLHKKIKEKYCYFSIGLIGFVTIDYDLQEKDFFDIIHIIDQHSDTYDFIKTNLMKIFNLMYEKERYDQNRYFRKAQNYFFDLANKNINSVSSRTLETITDANVIQPTPQLNALPPYIKKYFMDQAYIRHNINHSYDIILAGHKDVITAIAIHALTHRAATSSYKDKTLRLWDLTTGKSLGIFSEKLSAHCITFNTDGSLLATATNYKDNSSCIRIWNTQSTQYLHGWEVKESKFDSLSYENNTLIAGHKNSTSKVSIFFIANDSIITGTIDLPQQYTKEEPFYLTWGNYQVKNPYFKGHRSSTLTVTKKQCQKFCIYQQAIKNDPLNFTLEKINKPDFTEYEKDMLHKLLITEQASRRGT